MQSTRISKHPSKIVEIEKMCLDQVLTVAEAAALYNRSRKRIMDLCKSGGIIARQSSTIWLLSKASCDERWRK